MPYTKIKIGKSGEVELAWRDEGPKDTVEHKLSSMDEPRPEFRTALQALVRYVLDILELPADYAADLTVTGVSISENEHQGRGVVVTALKKLAGANAPLVLNTPHLAEDGNEAGPLLPRYAAHLVDELELEANRYRLGERAQRDLFKENAA